MATEILRPNDQGDEENITGEVPGGAHWALVDEAIADGDGTYIQTDNASYLRDLYNVVDHSVGAGTINHITVYAVCEAPIPPSIASLKIAIKSGTGVGAPGTVSESSEITITNQWASYNNQWTTNPATSAAWAWDEIDKLQIGLALQRVASKKQSKCTQVYVGVDYTTGPTPNAYNKILYTEEPPTPNAWNQVKQEAGTGWRKLLYT